MILTFDVAAELEGADAAQTDVPAGAHVADVEADDLRDIDFDEGECPGYMITCGLANSVCRG